eukprot:241336-Pleurochrysis_carterae.AAC.1
MTRSELLVSPGPLQPSVRPTSVSLCSKFAKGDGGWGEHLIVCSLVGVAIARACKPSACHVPGAV